MTLRIPEHAILMPRFNGLHSKTKAHQNLSYEEKD